MRGLSAASLIIALLGGCAEEASTPGQPTAAIKTEATVRATRRAFDGAPPVIPHPAMGAACDSCHTDTGTAVPGVGFAPPSPHAQPDGPSAFARCEQCHVFVHTDAVLVKSAFAGLEQDLRAGERLNPLAPPVIPHQVLLRENCAACHTGPAAREEIRCPHPERVRCQQCHVETQTRDVFTRDG